MLLRIRSRTGTARVQCDPTDSISTVVSKLGQGQVRLSKDPAGTQALEASASISSLGLSHGDMLHVIGGGGSTTAAAASSSSAAAGASDVSMSEAGSTQPRSAATGKHDRRSSRCRHSEFATCTFCASNAKATDAAQKCLHGPGAVCAVCSLKDVTGKKLKWMCRHAPDAKCPNCTKITKKFKKKKKKCTHPPHMKCPNCIGGSSKEEDEMDEGTDSIDRSKCRHGPNGMCDNCLPKESEAEKLKAATQTFSCRNHGRNGSCIECISRKEASKLKMKQQEAAHAKATSLDRDAANVFQNYVQQNGFTVHRCGVMYGRVEKGTIYCDVIYEPPQKGDEHTFTLEDTDSQSETVSKLAELLKLQAVGFIYTHPRRKFAISGREVAIAAKVCASSPNPKAFAVVTISQNKRGESAFEAFQLSDQTITLARQGTFDTEQDTSCIAKTLTPVIVEGSETKEVDTNFFINRLAIKDHRTEFYRSKFAVENRPQPSGQPAQTLGDIEALLAHEVVDKSPLHAVFGDFHLLLFLTTLFDIDVDIPAIIKGCEEKDASRLGNYKLLLSSHVGLAGDW